jgi:RNA polymerase sigma-70 factor (ECF subfamily)
MAHGAGAPAAIRQLMTELRSGKRDAADRLIELFYPELRRMAAARMRHERPDHTWQPTVLVNELYLELARANALPPGGPDADSEKASFLGLAGFLMKRLLIHHARPLYRRADKTGISEQLAESASGPQDLNEIEDLLDRLARVDPVLRRVVEMKVFEGMSRDEMAARLGCSLRTVARHWEFARHWLHDAMSGPGKP